MVNGLDLGELGIGDVREIVDPHEAEVALAEHFVRQILGSIKFGPVIEFGEVGLEEPDDELWCPRGDGDRPFSD